MRRPNFVFILADDLGYADLGCYGARADTSPQLDRLAAQGLRFSDGYANSPVCSPTRFALMTGRYQYRLRGGNEEPMTGAARGRFDLGLPPSHPTLPSLLRDAGYATALVGKWHLGHLPHFSPRQSGYESAFGPLGGGVDYFSHCYRKGIHDLYEDDVEVHRQGYLTDLISERAVSTIEKHSAGQRPFLLSVHYTAPHWPWLTRADEAESHRIDGTLAHLDGGSVETYHTMIRQMDEGIGAIVDALRRTGALENTLIVFTSDNGGERYSDTWPFVGQKMDLLEGGIRVPLIAHWPERIPAGSQTSQLAITMDWPATMLSAAGVAPHPHYPLDGIDLLPVLQSGGHTIERELFWRMHYRSQRAMRSGRWKYLQMDGNEFLFDVETDGRERANLALREPARLQAMRERYAAWLATMPPIPPDAAYALVHDEHNLARASG